MKTSEHLLQIMPVISGMVTPAEVEFIIDTLEEALVLGVPGDVVELGCNQGTTSVFIRKLLDVTNSTKNFHVYDSFEGLPEKTELDDLSIVSGQKGECKSSKAYLLSVFEHFNLTPPIINTGWFAEIDDQYYPDQICFAFLDGDFYTSITDSLNKIYHKLSPGAIVCVHDYGSDGLPGVERACADFLENKAEDVDQEIDNVGYFEKL